MVATGAGTPSRTAGMPPARPGRAAILGSWIEPLDDASSPRLSSGSPGGRGGRPGRGRSRFASGGPGRARLYAMRRVTHGDDS